AGACATTCPASLSEGGEARSAAAGEASAATTAYTRPGRSTSAGTPEGRRSPGWRCHNTSAEHAAANPSRIASICSWGPPAAPSSPILTPLPPPTDSSSDRGAASTQSTSASTAGASIPTSVPHAPRLIGVPTSPRDRGRSAARSSCAGLYQRGDGGLSVV